MDARQNEQLLSACDAILDSDTEGAIGAIIVWPDASKPSYAVQVGDGGREDVVDTISIAYLRCRFGGSRAYFICPGPGGGTECGRRVTKLRLSHRYFVCRKCNQLAYACQYENSGQRALSLTLANSEQAYRPCGMRNMGSLSTIS
jgi:hypothetical protein